MSVHDLAGKMIGEYLVIRPIGEGGMGVVYEAVDERIQRHVAIKLLLPEISSSPEATARFLQEAVAANQIAHAGIVSVEKHGRLEDGTCYLVMELLRGESLQARLRRSRGRLPGAEAIRVGRQVASALAAAHERGIVHRDLKPANLMLVPDPDMVGGERVKLLDFGIAKVQTALGAQPLLHTRANQIIGTPVYMAPEQFLESHAVAAPADVYALGVILYEVLAGCPPFQAEGLGALMDLHMNQPPRPLNDLDPTIAPELAGLIHAMLAKRREERPTMTQSVAALDRLSGQGARPSQSVTRSRSSLRSTLGQAAAQSSTRRVPGGRAGVALAALAGTLVLAGAAFVNRDHGIRRSVARPDGHPPSPVLPPPTPPRPEPPAAPPKALSPVHRVVHSHPSRAKVLRLATGELLGETPFHYQGDAHRGELAVVLRASGCAPLPVAIPLDRDGEQTEKLSCRSPPHLPPAPSTGAVTRPQEPAQENEDELDPKSIKYIR